MFCTFVKSALNSVEYKIHGLNILRTSHGNLKALPFAIKLIRHLGLHCIDSAANLNKVSVVPTSNVFLPGLRPFGQLLWQAEADTEMMLSASLYHSSGPKGVLNGIFR